MKILIVVPNFKILGGVANHYQGLDPYWKSDVKYCWYGKREQLPGYICLIPDILIFIFKLITGGVDVVIVNPSLRKYQLVRDGVYVLLAKLFRKKVVTFIHGWDWDLSEKIADRPRLFKCVYGKSTFIYVLFSEFKKRLDCLNMGVPVLLTTTKVSDELLDGFDIASRDGSINQILFLSRIIKTKGIDVTIDAFSILKQKYPQLKLSVCGDGAALAETKRLVKDLGVQDVVFHGSISGKNKVEQFVKSDIYILPTHEEGMATSVLEAMAYGLPIISRPVGGVQDFFEGGEMGYLIKSLDASEYAEIIENLILSPNLTRQISQTNYNYASSHFLASQVTNKFENDLREYCVININK